MNLPCTSALLTDLYQLTMLQAYWQHRISPAIKALADDVDHRQPKTRAELAH